MVIHSGCVAATGLIGFAKGIMCHIKPLNDFPQINPRFRICA
jgi:hypothetical protein